MEPSEFMTDFEAGLRKSIKEIYPKSKLRGCWLHFCKAVRQNAIRFGLYALLKNSSEAKFIFKSLLCLPLLPESLIMDGYKLIKQRALENGLMGQMRKFFAYFESYWLVMVNNKIITK